MSSEDANDYNNHYHKSLNHFHCQKSSTALSLPPNNFINNKKKTNNQQQQHQLETQTVDRRRKSLNRNSIYNSKTSLHYITGDADGLSVQSQQQQQQQQPHHQHQQPQQQQQQKSESRRNLTRHNSSSNILSMASPSRYSPHPEGFHHLGSGRLSIHQIDHYNECCLPPPSPAPTSDRYVMGMPAPSSNSSISSVASSREHHHYSDQQSQAGSSLMTDRHSSNSGGGGNGGATGANNSNKFGSMHRTMSPSSRYRISDRYRDLSPKCTSDRYTGSQHYLSNNTPLVSTDAYTYLSSTVHTPVKRYVPTPPPPTEIYSDIPQQSAGSSASSTSGYHTIGGSSTGSHYQQQPTQQQQQQNQHVNTLPYRYRMKCCINDAPASLSTNNTNTNSAAQPQQNSSNRLNTSDHYATPPRLRPIKCTSTSTQANGNIQQSSSSCNSQQQLVRQSSRANSLTSQCLLNEFIARTPSIEYLGSAGGRVVTPVSVMSEPANTTCLHCNTMRRTTGVHQTTQTGPISPVPTQQQLQQLSTLNSNNSALGTHHEQIQIQNDCNSPTPAGLNQTQLSPLSPQQQQSSHQPQISQPHHEQIICSPHPQQAHINQPQSGVLLSSHSSLVSSRNMQQQALHQQPQLQSSSIIGISTAQPQLAQPQNTNRNHMMLPSSSNQNVNSSNVLQSTPQRSTLRSQIQPQRASRKQRLKEYIAREIAKFFGVDIQSEDEEMHKWNERQKRLAIRRFGPLKTDDEAIGHVPQHLTTSERPDILPAQTEESQISHMNGNLHVRIPIEKKSSVFTMIISGILYIIQTLNKRQHRNVKQWSRSFAPAHVMTAFNGDNPGDICEGLTALQEEEVFFDSPGNEPNGQKTVSERQNFYMGERVHGWRTSAVLDQQHLQQQPNSSANQLSVNQRLGIRGTRISSQILDGVLENSRRPIARKVKMFRSNELDDRDDYRPFFTYWINTVQIIVLMLSLICYGTGPFGFGVEQKTGQVLVTSLSLQTVQHQELRNLWIGPRNSDLVHLGAKFAACMRRDIVIIDVMAKTRRQERETACCIRNDDSGCVQSSQADCSVRGLWPTKSISTWKKWSPGESGPGGRISGSVCGLDPKFCDAPASIAPYEWPDDITKWPICRKTNAHSLRIRYKDHTAEHMVCEVIGHPCCTGVFGECRITTKEYCDFVNGYFHEEASLCSQISCLNNVCGMFPFVSVEIPDQFYRLFTSLCLHAGIIHLLITIAFQHIFLADLERLIGPIRTAIVYIGSGLAGNLTSAILVPYKPEVGPLASLASVISSLLVLLLLIHWRQLKKPHIALMKLIFITGTLFGMGTLPWQQNFAGLIAGIFCGVFLTIAFVPFVSITKYARKSKINLIWICIIFHLFIYTIMFIVFYLFPTELNFGDLINGNGNNMNQHYNHKNRFDIDNFGHHHVIDDQGGEDRVMSGTINEMSSRQKLVLNNNNKNTYISNSKYSNYNNYNNNNNNKDQQQKQLQQKFPLQQYYNRLTSNNLNTNLSKNFNFYLNGLKNIGGTNYYSNNNNINKYIDDDDDTICNNGGICTSALKKQKTTNIKEKFFRNDNGKIVINVSAEDDILAFDAENKLKNNINDNNKNNTHKFL